MAMSVLTIALNSSAQPRQIIGIDLSSLILFRSICLNAGYSFHEKWSADFDMTVNAGRLFDRHKKEETEHWKELYGERTHHQSCDLTEGSITLSFWTQRTFDGPVLSLGCSIRNREGPDISVGAGYYCSIWKGIKCFIVYRTGILESINDEFIPSRGIKLGVSYAF